MIWKIFLIKKKYMRACPLFQKKKKKKKGYTIGGKKLKVAYSRPQSKEIQNSNLYVTNVPSDWDNERLGQVFRPFGFVVESRILVDQDGRSRSVGFVRMDNNGNALKAISGIHSYGIDGGVELVVKVLHFCFFYTLFFFFLKLKNQNRRWGMNPSGDYISEGGHDNRQSGHRNNRRRSGGMMPDQSGDPNRNFEAQS
ncbi:hypothetical protein RFI_15478 [Reticulomyxa filosa]|uniref:RRM domain-containing protein n=1 Tax=Reticulomyxa filosa TaxID=46433 RepID=X6N7J2_RETFI|nr:hypothetical protein RFI_15478 [Reticulomyxa filosa]|eukprot:ETO21724.1 hypothetical protein RFI_15478 [Reticulomyxa filosa]